MTIAKVFATGCTALSLAFAAQTATAAGFQAIFGTDDWAGIPTQDLPSQILQAKDGGYFVTGSNDAKKEAAGKIGSTVIKVSAAGKVEWIKMVSDKFDAVNGGANAVTADGGLIMGGHDPSGAQLTRLDKAGNKVWEKVYPDNNSSGVAFVTEHADGSYSAVTFGVGSTRSLLTIDKNGAQTGRKEIAGKYDGTGGVGHVTQTKDGGFTLCGATDKKVRLVKVDKGGGVQWDHSYPFDGDARTVLQTADGYVMGGFTSAGSQEAGLIKVDDAGKQVWSKTFGGPDGYVVAVTPTKDGGFLAGGHKTPPGKKDASIFFFKVDKTGNKTWEKAYGEGSAQAGLATSDGGLAVIGQTSAMGAKWIDDYLVRADANGEAGATPAGKIVAKAKAKKGKAKKKAP